MNFILFIRVLAAVFLLITLGAAWSCYQDERRYGRVVSRVHPFFVIATLILLVAAFTL